VFSVSSMTAPVPASWPESSRPPDRILAEARALFFSRGYAAFTMDDLALACGMSKKTLYVHFAGKDATLRAVIDSIAAEIRADADQLLNERRLQFIEKLRGFAQAMIERFPPLTATFLLELETRAPALHRHLLRTRARTIPDIFGRFVEEGQLSGAIRDDILPSFATEFFLHAMQGLMQGSTLKHLRIGADACFDQAIRLFFGGLLTPEGRHDYETAFASR
jgi:Transcriptional regulator